MIKTLRLFRKLTIRQKLALIAILMSLPIPFITWLFIAEKNNAASSAQLELNGVEYIVPLKRLSIDIARHRGSVNAFLKGETSARARITDAEIILERNLNLLDEIDSRELSTSDKSYGTLLQTTVHLRGIKKQWERIKSSRQNRLPEEQFSDQTQLIGDSIDLIRRVADTSTLIMDPQPNTYYLKDAMVIMLPEMFENISQLRDIGSGIAASKLLSQGDIVKISSLSTQIRRNIRSFERSLEKVYNTNPELKDKHGDVISSAFKDIDSFIDISDKRLVRADIIDLLPNEYFKSGTLVIDKLIKADELIERDLSELLITRIDEVHNERNIFLFLIAIGILIASIAVSVVAGSIIRQAKSIGNLISEIDKGNLEERAEVMSDDELGRTARAFNAMLDNTRGLIQSRDERDRIQNAIIKLLDDVSSVAEGDLTREVEVTSDITGAIADAFNHMIEQLRRLISQVQSVTSQVTVTSAESYSESEKLAVAGKVQAAQISDASVALECISTDIQRISKEAVNSVSIADAAVVCAEKGALAVRETIRGMIGIREQVQDTSNRIKQLSERSGEIVDIVRLIEEIADRTGVLALNASIQASTAGDAGKGFVIVANEVEQLAKRSTDAAKRISNLVQVIQTGTTEAITAMDGAVGEVLSGSKLADTAGRALIEIESVSQSLAESVHIISITSKRQADQSRVLSRAMTDIASATSSTATSLIQSADTVKNLTDLADRLRSSVSSFKISNAQEEVSRFKFHEQFQVSSFKKKSNLKFRK